MQSFLSLYYIDPTPLESIDNGFKPVVLNYEIKELNSDNVRFSRTVPLYDQPSPCNNIEENAHDLLFTFYSIIKSPPFTGSHFTK